MLFIVFKPGITSAPIGDIVSERIATQINQTGGVAVEVGHDPIDHVQRFYGYGASLPELCKMLFVIPGGMNLELEWAATISSIVQGQDPYGRLKLVMAQPSIPGPSCALESEWSPIPERTEDPIVRGVVSINTPIDLYLPVKLTGNLQHGRITMLAGVVRKVGE